MSDLTGVLVMSYGTPTASAGIEAYYTRIRHGHPPSEAQLADLVRRYDAIGGTSPLNERTAAQAAGIAAALDAIEPGRYHVALGTKYAEPTIEAGVEQLVAAGAREVVGLVLAPLSAPMSTGQYHERAAAALGPRAAYRPIWSWAGHAGFAQLVARRVTDAVAAARDGQATVVFSAHSLPRRVVEEGSDYADQLAAAADAIAAVAGLRAHLVCWQSAGRTNDEWLGPDICELIRALDPREVHDLVVCPVGFVADHLEVLYDIDIEARGLAAARGIDLRRTASLNDDPGFCAILADVVAGAAAAAAA